MAILAIFREGRRTKAPKPESETGQRQFARRSLVTVCFQRVTDPECLSGEHPDEYWGRQGGLSVKWGRARGGQLARFSYLISATSGVHSEEENAN